MVNRHWQVILNCGIILIIPPEHENALIRRQAEDHINKIYVCVHACLCVYACVYVCVYPLEDRVGVYGLCTHSCGCVYLFMKARDQC